MNFSVSGLMAGFVFGVWGVYLIRRAKRDADIVKLVIGLTLCIYPYFIDNVYLLWGIGAALCAAAYKL